jgi:hypothetical protein
MGSRELMKSVSCRPMMLGEPPSRGRNPWQITTAGRRALGRFVAAQVLAIASVPALFLDVCASIEFLEQHDVAGSRPDTDL